MNFRAGLLSDLQASLVINSRVSHIHGSPLGGFINLPSRLHIRLELRPVLSGLRLRTVMLPGPAAG
jgi:hypothetical protein